MIRSTVALLALCAAVSACGPALPSRVDPPAEGSPEVGLSYGVVVYCPEGIQLGSTWRLFWAADMNDWPADRPAAFPFIIFDKVGDFEPVSGTVTLSSPTAASFRADVDGSKYRLALVPDGGPGGCL